MKEADVHLYVHNDVGRFRAASEELRDFKLVSTQLWFVVNMTLAEPQKSIVTVVTMTLKKPCLFIFTSSIIFHYNIWQKCYEYEQQYGQLKEENNAYVESNSYNRLADVAF